jgi:hypothetical protein
VARRPTTRPIEWADVQDDEGVVIGWYGIQDDMITVRAPNGAQRTTRAGPLSAAQGLARFMLEEPWALNRMM